MQPNSAPYTSDEVKTEISRVRRIGRGIAIAFTVIAVIACVVVLGLSIGIPV